MNLFEDAGRLTIEQLKGLKKKIPKRGLNNRKKKPYWFDEFREVHHVKEWVGDPTLPDRMERFLFGLPYLPPQMVAMGVASGVYDDEAKRLLTDCFELLADLKDNLDDVTVINKEEITRYKLRIDRLNSYLRVSGKLLGLMQDAEFAVCDEV
jgi:hypothetical protein